MINKKNQEILSEKSYDESMPLLSIMNKEMYGVIRWCTPSIHPRVPRVNGIYDSDMSISYHHLGNPSLNTGVFKVANALAARAYKAEHTLFGVNGSSGSNFIILRALSHQLGKVNLLAQRNVHKSISVAVEDYAINVNYLEPHYDEELQIFIPNTISEFIQGLKKYPETNVVFISNPTYEGLSLDLPKLVKSIRKINPKIIIFVDEAWGALFPFSSKMPICAMLSGADISVQSTHKQGSGLQQTSMIHWQGKRVKESYIMDSYKSLATTSPSFHLLASLDGARYLMQTQGESIIADLLDIAKTLGSELSKINSLEVVTSETIMKKYPQVKYTDKTKVLVNVKKTGFPGYEIAKRLEEECRIVIEKYEAENIFFLAVLQNTKLDSIETARRTAGCIKKLLQSKKPEKISFPKFPVKIKKALSAYEVREKKIFQTKLENCENLICAEDIVPYPPGIPLITKGEVIQKEHIDYLKAIKKLKGLISIVINDEKIETIKTVKNN